MKFEPYLLESLKIQLQQSLPGEEIRHRLSPPYRPPLSKEEILSRHPNIGGVLVLLYNKSDTLHLVLTERKQYEGVHGGQMSLPGGRKDDTDSTLIHTALRETEEEVGVEAASINILGSLTELYIPPSNFLVYPSVGFSPAVNTFQPQKEEVEKVVEIPVEFFLDDANIHPQTRIRLHNGNYVTVPSYIFNQHIIWGATALMLHEFVHVFRKAIENKG